MSEEEDNDVDIEDDGEILNHADKEVRGGISRRHRK